MSTTSATITLEPAAQALVAATGTPPFLFQLPSAEGRQALEDLQSGEVDAPEVEIEDISVPFAGGKVPVRILRPFGHHGSLPAILYIHGAGWVFGSKHTHDRLIRELCAGSGCAGRVSDLLALARGALPNRNRAELCGAELDLRA